MLECPLMAISGHTAGSSRTSALPPKADIHVVIPRRRLTITCRTTFQFKKSSPTRVAHYRLRASQENFALWAVHSQSRSEMRVPKRSHPVAKHRNTSGFLRGPSPSLIRTPATSPGPGIISHVKLRTQNMRGFRKRPVPSDIVNRLPI